MQARRYNRKRPTNNNNNHVIGAGLREIVFIGFCFISLYLFISLLTYNPLDPTWSDVVDQNTVVNNKGGLAGSYFADAFFNLFGYFSYLFAIMVAHLGWLIYQGKHKILLAEPKILVIPGLGFLLTLSAGCGLAIVHFSAESALLPSHAGGVLGQLVGRSLESIFSQLGATLVLLALFFTGVTLLTGLSWLRLMDILGYYTLKNLPIVLSFIENKVLPLFWDYFFYALHWLKVAAIAVWHYLDEQWWLLRQRFGHVEYDDDEEIEEKQPPKPVVPVVPVKTAPVKPPAPTPVIQDESQLDALKQTPVVPSKQLNRQQLSQQLKTILQQLDLDGNIQIAPSGPVLTRVDIQLNAVDLAQSNRVASLVLSELGEKGVRISTVLAEQVSLEVPNPTPETILLGTLLRSNLFQKGNATLGFALGKDINNHPMVLDLARMPHLLLAGEDPSDIDKALHSLLLSLFYKAEKTPSRFILFDSTRKVLDEYRDIPYLITPIINDLSQAEPVFRWCVNEMERRYHLMSAQGLRNISGYNQRMEQQQKLQALKTADTANLPEPLPYLIIVVHELAALQNNSLEQAQKNLEEHISRLAQKARAAGIHMVIATSEPTIHVVSGLMKTNFSTRIAFKVKDPNTAHNILGQNGAETLLGQGDMLYLTPGTGVLVRAHGAQVTLSEIRNVVAELRKQGQPQYQSITG